MILEIEIPDKYADKLEEVEAVEPTVRDQIEIEVLPDVLRMINDAHRQVTHGDFGEVEAELGDKDLD